MGEPEPYKVWKEIKEKYKDKDLSSEEIVKARRKDWDDYIKRLKKEENKKAIEAAKRFKRERILRHMELRAAQRQRDELKYKKRRMTEYL